MSLLNRKDLLTKQVLEIKKVDLGNDEFVHVKEMTGKERDLFEQSLRIEVKSDKVETQYKNDLDNFRAKLAVVTLCNEEGVLLLQSEDAEKFSTCISARRMDAIATAAQSLNKISDKDKDAMVKNSEADQPGDSTSDSVKS